MTYDYSRLAATSKRLLDRFGAPGTMSRESGGAYDSETGTVQNMLQSWGCIAAVVDYAARDIDGTLVQVGDVKILVAPGIAEPPKVGDKFRVAERDLIAVRVGAVAPAGAPVLYEVQGRGVDELNEPSSGGFPIEAGADRMIAQRRRIMRWIIAASFSAAVLMGCAVAPSGPTVARLTEPFDNAAAASQMEPGSATLEGNAFMQQRGGGVVTCAGYPVQIMPVTRYATERFSVQYGEVLDGETAMWSAADAAQHKFVFEPDPPEFHKARRLTKCDSSGNFQFDDLRAGSYYVMTAVIWNVGYRTQGGALLTRVTLRDGQHKRIIVSQ